MSIGPTGEYPNGKLNREDEGELKLAVGMQNGIVMIMFGTPVTWFGLKPHEARELSRMILKNADKADVETKKKS